MEGQVSSLAKEFTWGGLEVGENYAWCFVIEQRGGRGGGKFFIILEVRGQETKGDTFLGGLTPLDTILSTGISF